MKRKLIRTLLIFVSIVLILLYIGPFITTGEINIGTITGIGIAAVFALYAGLFDKINNIFKKLSSKKAGKAALLIVAVLFSACIITAGATFAAIVSGSRNDNSNNNVIIVLGCQVNENKPGHFLSARINTAYNYLSSNENSIAVLSGGKGSGESISEAQCMFNTLVEKGIDPSRLYIEDESTSTLENFQNSAALLKAYGIEADKITVVTNDFHEYRACKFAESCGFSPSSCPAKTPWNGFMPFATREIYAVIYQIYLN